MASPVEDFFYLVNNVLLGEEPSIEDYLLLLGTIVAGIAFILWCCFPSVPKEGNHLVLLYQDQNCEIVDKYTERRKD